MCFLKCLYFPSHISSGGCFVSPLFNIVLLCFRWRMNIPFIHITLTFVGIFYYARTCGSTFVPYRSGLRNEQQVTEAADKREEYNNVQDHSSSNTMLLDSILNLRVLHESQLCPRTLVIQFLATGDLSYLRECANDGMQTHRQSQSEASSSGHTNVQPSDNSMSSYSGKLLKRILQTMNNDETTSAEINSDIVQTDNEKRSRPRLSINVALSSLADMLRHQSRRNRHHGRQYGFHQRLLNLG